MRILVVGAGASFSTKDVEVGLSKAFLAHEVETELYALDRRIDLADRWVSYVWRYIHDKNPDLKPHWDDVVYRAGIGAIEMALRLEPDWVFVISAMYFHPDVIVMMKRAGLKVAVLFTESPYEDIKQARVAQLVDMCWVNERTSVEYMRQLNPNTYYYQHATYDPGVGAVQSSNKCSVSPNMPAHDVVFVGSGFQERLDLLDSVDWTGLNVGLYGSWSLLPSRHRLRKHIKGGIVSAVETRDLYRRAKIGLNLYRRSREYSTTAELITSAESANPRAYDLAFDRCFSLSEYRKEAEDVFGDSQPFFEGPKELRELIDRYLDDGAERQRLANLAYERVQEHTFLNRAGDILTRLQCQ